MAHFFKIVATEHVRARFPDLPQRTLARRIASECCPNNDDKGLSDAWFTAGCNVPEATIYSRIRRYDERRAAEERFRITGDALPVL